MGEVICSPLSRVELGTRGPAGSGVILDCQGLRGLVNLTWHHESYNFVEIYREGSACSK